MHQVEVICPNCEKKGNINISEDSLKNNSRGILTVNIPKDRICEHSFIAYVDRNLKVRDYFIADFEFKIPDIRIRDGFNDIYYTNAKNFKIDLILLNLPAKLISYILKAIFLKKNILLIIEEQFIGNQVIEFFKFITDNNFTFNLVHSNYENYKHSKNLYKNYVIFKVIDVLRDKDNIIDHKKLKVERNIVQKFLSERDLKIMVLKNEIQKAFNLSKMLIEIVKDFDKNNKINILKISEALQERIGINVDINYLNFLVEITQNYHNVKLPIIYDRFLGFI